MPQSKDSKEAMESFDAHNKGTETAIPDAEEGIHNKSEAAHLESTGHVKTTPEGYGKQGREPGSLKEPPQEPGRNGKGRHRE